jgi:TP53 regulating kinase-like protein
MLDLSSLPPVPRYYNPNTWTLISQGAEARIWVIDNFITKTVTTITDDEQHKNETTLSSCNNFMQKVICKERFSKSYRHPSLDETLTKARTKGEARSLVRCRRGGVSVPCVLGVDLDVPTQTLQNGSNNARNSACLFLEYVQGCTLRDFISSSEIRREKKQENQSEGGQEEDHHQTKKIKISDSDQESIDDEESDALSDDSVSITFSEDCMKAVHATGVAISKMHNTNIIHGDLTTSNIFIRNPPKKSEEGIGDNNNQEWKPDIVLIDFGLSSTSAISNKQTKGKNANINSSLSCHEERAVDLYVLERAFITTHAGSEDLVKELLRAYKGMCFSSDSVLQRLSQVRLRGRKRECFG